MTASRGFQVMLLAFVVLQSYVKAIVTVLGSGGASYRAKGLKPPPPVFAAAPPEFLCKVKSDTLLLFQGVK